MIPKANRDPLLFLTNSARLLSSISLPCFTAVRGCLGVYRQYYITPFFVSTDRVVRAKAASDGGRPQWLIYMLKRLYSMLATRVRTGVVTDNPKK